eukprot:TRINITY_DN23420_c0_g1_i11.p3 TRINITY_DN23420_c0_g1~~TRINITY_DN23420_c0_g1_i11.p3  ORF type:complete len:211 (-),score=-1.19 TRINITY_DN23420_c0_g1_i11:302-934(-)
MDVVHCCSLRKTSYECYYNSVVVYLGLECNVLKCLIHNRLRIRMKVYDYKVGGSMKCCFQIKRLLMLEKVQSSNEVTSIPMTCEDNDCRVCSSFQFYFQFCVFLIQIVWRYVLVGLICGRGLIQEQLFSIIIDVLAGGFCRKEVQIIGVRISSGVYIGMLLWGNIIACNLDHIEYQYLLFGSYFYMFSLFFNFIISFFFSILIYCQRTIF